MIDAIVLAAGSGSRFGGPKVVAPLDGVPLVRRVVERLTAGGVRHIHVIVGAHAAAIGAALEGVECTLVPVVSGTEMSDSLRAGVESLAPDATGFFVALGDQPGIDPALVRRLGEAWEGSTTAAVVPVYRGGVHGHPVLFDATMRRRVAALTGDRGARDLLQAMGDRVTYLDVDAPVPVDVDTPEDLARLRG